MRFCYIIRHLGEIQRVFNGPNAALRHVEALTDRPLRWGAIADLREGINWASEDGSYTVERWRIE